MRIAVLGAGGPAGVNVCRALNDAGHDVYGQDDNRDHLVWAEPFCTSTFGPLGAKLNDWGLDVVCAQPDSMVRWLSRQDVPKLMPSSRVIERCQDKTQAIERWSRLGLVRSSFVDVNEMRPPFWLRATSGAGARGATLIENRVTAYHWVRYWQSRGVDWEFMAEEYLPGRDYCWSSLWHDGVLVAAFARERLEWIYPHLSPSGRTGTPSISETVHNHDVNEMGFKAVRAVDDRPNGIYCVDLREDKNGIPRPTEINAGRWATTTPLYSELGVNLPDLHARLAVGDDIESLGNDIYPAGIRLSRHIDCGHVFTGVPVCA